MHIKFKFLLVMCLIKGYSFFDYYLYDENDKNNGSVDPNELMEDPNGEGSNRGPRTTTVLTTRVTDNPRGLIGVCVVRYKDQRFRRVTYVKVRKLPYIAECCGGLKNCTRIKKLYRFEADFKLLEPIRRYHQVCCKGYERNYTEPYLPGGNINCIPVCDPQCARGICIAPQNCSCYLGYYNNPEEPNECIEGCVSECKFASCVGIQLCQCDFGYRAVNEDYCEPRCGPLGCRNGNCIKPFTCNCYNGYRKDPDDPYLCVPKCDNDCGNGTCIRPGVCECPPGEKYYPKFSCCLPPLCTNDCGRGICIPTVHRCSCPYPDFVYIRNNDTCIALCKEPCYGGDCMDWNTCVCFKDFQKVKFGCMDKCKNKCGYGKCMPDGECYCDEKLYVKPKSVIQKLEALDSGDGNRKKYSKKIMECIPRADNCFETGGKVLAPWICKCPSGKRYVKPKGCLAEADAKLSGAHIQNMERAYQYYSNIELVP